jgi:hypothetical protein
VAGRRDEKHPWYLSGVIFEILGGRKGLKRKRYLDD